MSNRHVAFYARVSSESQARDNTIASQITALRERITVDGEQLAPDDAYVEEGYSGSLLIRPALERLRDAVAAGGIERLYVLAPDRLARRHAHQALLMEELRRGGVEVVFLNRSIGDTAEDDLLLQMQGVIAEYERAKILERSRRGRRHAARSGLLSAFTTAPFGYRYVPKDQGGGVARFEWWRRRREPCGSPLPGSAWSGSACAKSVGACNKPALRTGGGKGRGTPRRCVGC
jgi:site-specific DNA recombinase